MRHYIPTNLKSIFTSDLNKCAVTHIYRGLRRIEVHHVFGAANRRRSTQYGYVIPLVAEIHPNGASASDKECQRLTGLTLKELDLRLKQECQYHYEKHHGTRDDFIKEFGRNYLA